MPFAIWLFIAMFHKFAAVLCPQMNLAHTLTISLRSFSKFPNEWSWLLGSFSHVCYIPSHLILLDYASWIIHLTFILPDVNSCGRPALSMQYFIFSGSLGFWTLSIIQYSEQQKRIYLFRNLICCHPQGKGWETPTLLNLLEKANFTHR
jgi:hypothetical protein